MRLIMLITFAIGILLISAACQTSRINQITGRPTGYIGKEGDLYVHSRDTSETAQPPQIYVKHKDQKITPKDPASSTGSLFHPQDESTYLYTEGNPEAIGRIIVVAVVFNHIPGQKPGEADKDKKKTSDQPAPDAPPPTKKDAKGGKDQPPAEDPVIAELMKSLPNLDPAHDHHEPIVKQIPMKIIHRFENGDVLASYTRSSQTETNSHEIQVKVRIPYPHLIKTSKLSTADLTDIRWLETTPEGELVERRSEAWEDEYTLRLSGYDEAKSRLALELDDKQKQLQESRDHLTKQIESFGAEKRTFTAEREKLLEEKAQDRAKIEELTKQIPPEKKEDGSQDQTASKKTETKNNTPKGDDTAAAKQSEDKNATK